MSYGIAYLDMYDYGASRNGPEFTTADEALAHAKKVLDADLQQAFKPGMTAKDLYDNWMMFGEDVVIAAMDGESDLRFSGQEYVRRRCEEMCGLPPEQPPVGTPNGAEGAATAAESRMTTRDLREPESSFPPGSTFWNFKDVPVLMDETGRCTAWDQSEVTHEKVFDSGIQISEAEFYDLVQSQGRLKGSTFPAGTSFAELDGVPVIISQYGSCTAIDGSFCSRAMLHDWGSYLSEVEYLALVAIFKAKTR